MIKNFSFFSNDNLFLDIQKKIWDTHWGELYAKDSPQNYEGKNQKLKDEIKKLPTVKVMTLTQMSYKPVKPYNEWHDFKRKSFERYKQTEHDVEES